MSDELREYRIILTKRQAEIVWLALDGGLDAGTNAGMGKDYNLPKEEVDAFNLVINALQKGHEPTRPDTVLREALKEALGLLFASLVSEHLGTGQPEKTAVDEANNNPIVIRAVKALNGE